MAVSFRSSSPDSTAATRSEVLIGERVSCMMGDRFPPIFKLTWRFFDVHHAVIPRPAPMIQSSSRRFFVDICQLFAANIVSLYVD